jgi:hypothetical protein
MNDETDNRFRSGEPPNGSGDSAPSGLFVLFYMAILALVLVGGYFFVMKFIEIRRQEDCILAGGRNCVAPIPLPSNR